jgi:peptidoglycan L-alanyl-D-glutamate endopeptidase CwlK
MSYLSEASREKLATCHPDLQRLISAVADRVDFTVLCGHRTEAEQNKAVAERKSKTPWPKSKHNTLPSQAVDVWPYAGGVNWEDVPAAARLMGYIQAHADLLGIKIRLGMDWDMDWKSAGKDPGEFFYDGPHLELVL